MEWFENCACLTAIGNCSRDVRTIKQKGKNIIVGWQRCPLYDGIKKGCQHYYYIKTNG